MAEHVGLVIRFKGEAGDSVRGDGDVGEKQPSTVVLKVLPHFYGGWGQLSWGGGVRVNQ